MPQDCSWLFGRGASIDCGLSWVIPSKWARDYEKGKIDREKHITRITNAINDVMDGLPVPTNSYRKLLDTMASRTVAQGHHKPMTTNWDYLLQREVIAWTEDNKPGWAPRFLSTHSTVYHFNGSAEPGEFQNRSPFLLETDDADIRRSTYEANHAFNLLLWSTLVVIVGMSFECDIDKGLLSALRAHEDNLPIGSAHFVILDPCKKTLDDTYKKLAACFPRASGIIVNRSFSEWVNDGMSELDNLIFNPISGNTDDKLESE